VYTGSKQTGVAAGSAYDLSGATTGTNAGTYTATATLVDSVNYQWSDGTTDAKSVSWKIAAASLASAKVTASNKTYTGKALTSAPTVKLGDVTLTSGTDYTVSYKNNVNAGKATVTVTGKGNYTGSASGTFTINKAKVAVPVAAKDLVYDGAKETGVAAGANYTLSGTAAATKAGSYTAKAALADAANYQWSDGSSTEKSIAWTIAPAPASRLTVASVGNKTYTGSAIKPAPAVKDGKVTLKSGTDYALSYKSNVNAGTATITVTGKGNYTGTKTGTFKIVAAGISGATVGAISNRTYTGKAIAAEPKITFGGKTLVKGTDYTLAYKDNVNVGTAIVTITGKGNLGGTATTTFKIVAADISKAKIPDVAGQTYSGKALAPKPTVAFGGATLKEGVDYTLAYKDNVNAGTATVTVTGKGNYVGSASAQFTIAPASITKATIASVADKTYTGSAIKPAPAVKLGATTLKSGTDYAVSYKGNVNAGTATITVTGKGNYSGTRTATFKIAPASITKAKVAAVPDQRHTGKAVTPEPSVTFGGKTLAKGTDYTLSYRNNVEVGDGAVITITGKGNFTGKTTVAFEIKVATQEMHRLYNPNSGEHFYTAKAGERDQLVKLGWNYEGVGWIAPVTSKTPVYRLYNPVAGDHHYTTKAAERDALVKAKWVDEGIGWYSDDDRGVPLYRQYNPNAVTGTHNYTTNAAERDFLVKSGWVDEGIGWYGVKL